MRRLFLLLALSGALLPRGAQAADPDSLKSLKDVTATLMLSRPVYDAIKPSTARIRCVFRNRSKAAVEVPVGYDGRLVRLHAGLLTLHPRPEDRQAPGPGGQPLVKTFRLEPGAEVTVFDLRLDAILLKQVDEVKPDGQHGRWYWDWPRRSAPPRSPLQRRTGTVDQTFLQAEIMVGENRVNSEPVTLKIKPAAPVEPDNSL